VKPILGTHFLGGGDTGRDWSLSLASEGFLGRSVDAETRKVVILTYPPLSVRKRSVEECFGANVQIARLRQVKWRETHRTT